MSSLGLSYLRGRTLGATARIDGIKRVLSKSAPPGSIRHARGGAARYGVSTTRSASTVVSSMRTPNPGRLGTVRTPSLGLIGSSKKNCNTPFSFGRYSAIGQTVGGSAAETCRFAGTGVPWGITGTSWTEASVKILSSSLIPPAHKVSGCATSTAPR